jgi:H+/Cl- antiporter ClcA
MPIKLSITGTPITLDSGFSGGVIAPLFMIGATTGDTFGHLLGINPVLGAAVGMMAVVAAASNTPIFAIVMGVELFGRFIGVYVLAASITAYIIIGH